MCEPISATTAALAAASIGSGVYQNVRGRSDARRAAEAQSEQARAELQRQNSYRQDAQSALTQALSQTETPRQEADFSERVAARQAIAAPLAPTPETFTASRSAAPAIVTENVNASLSGAADDTAQRTAALARLLAYGDQALGNQIALSRSGQQVGQIAGLANASNRVNALEQDAAGRNAQKGPSLAADLIGGAADLALLLTAGGQRQAPQNESYRSALAGRGA